MFLYNPAFAVIDSSFSGYGVVIEGYITVGDSTDFMNNPKCVDVEGIGFYTCTSTLRGRYITFISVTIVGSTLEGAGLAFINLSAYGSTNLVVTSTLVEEPDLQTDGTGNVPSHITSYSTLMA